MTGILHISFVAIGAFLGAVSRYVLSQVLNKGNIPWGTLIVNLTGSFLLVLIDGLHLGQAWVWLLGTGFMGSFTTFSTLKLEHLELTLKRNWKSLLIYSILTYGGGIFLAWLCLIIL